MRCASRSTTSSASPAGRGLHAVPALGVRAPGGRLPLLLHYPYYLLYSSQVVQAGRSRPRALPRRRRLLAGAEGARLRVLRDDHRARLVALGVDPGDRGRGGRPPRPRARVPARERARRSPRPGGQHRRRRAPRCDARHLARRRRRVRRDARPRRRAGVLAPTARGLDRIAFRLRYRGRRLRVEIGPQEATYELLDGEELPIHHHGDWLKLEPGPPVTRPLPPPLTPEPVQQPPGREPARRAHGERVSVAPDE